MSAGGGAFGRPPPSHHPPIRDTSTLKYVLYGPGHEKYPSWPMPAATEIPVAIRAPATGGSQRSKSWTDHTNYPKEQVIPYTRPYMKRSNSSQPQQLKTVLERCQKKKIYSIQYIHKMDLRKNSNNNDYNSSSPPERDQRKSDLPKEICKAYSKEPITPLTQADLEEYTKKFDETTHIQHQKQSSYAQSEGYHSYVSSSDSSTPFIDSLRRDIDASVICMSHVSSWDGESTVTTRSGSVSSSETLKWHGSMSDMSEVSNSSDTSPRQLIVHSARVKTPQKQNSESVLYMAKTSTLPDRSSVHRTSHSNTLPTHRLLHQNSFPSPVTPRKTVAECIDIYEGKNIKAIQKKALLSFYERHQEQCKKDVRTSLPSNTTQPMMLRQSSLEPTILKKLPQNMDNKSSKEPIVTCDSPNSIFQGPVIMGPSISLDDWVPERPPKNRQLLMPSLPPDNSLKSQRYLKPNIAHVSQTINAADSDILYKYDDPFIPSPEQDKELRNFPMRMLYDGHKQTGEPQIITNKMSQQINKQVYNNKPVINTPRKLINPYIKSTSMKYDAHHKLDHMHSMHMNNSVQLESNHNAQSKLETLINKSTSHQSFANLSGPFRAEPLTRRHDINDVKSSQKVLENIKYVQNKNDQLRYEISGQYRAEPLNLQLDEHLSCNKDSNKNFSDKFKCQNSNFNHNSIPPPIDPKIYRSKSESHHVKPNISSSNSPNSSFAKLIPQRRPVDPETSNSSSNLFGSLENASIAESRIHITAETTIPIFNNLNKENISMKDKNQTNTVVKDDRPPLPEKKKNLLIKLNEISATKQINAHQTNKLPIIESENKIETTDNKIINSPVKSIETNEVLIEVKTTIPIISNNDNSKVDGSNDNTVVDQNVTPINVEESNVHKDDTVQNVNFNSNIKKLQARQFLPEELCLNKMCQILLHNLSDNHPLKTVILELEEYNKTAQDIVDIFAGDVEILETPISDTNESSNINTSEFLLNTIIGAENVSGDRPLNTNCDKFDNLKIEECLNSLIIAFQNQGDDIENMMKTNDDAGSAIISNLKEPHSTRLNRLITEIGLITSLMCGLLSKYNRVIKSLHQTSQCDKKSVLETERGRLVEKLEDAKALKKNIDGSRAKLLPILKSELKDGLGAYNQFLTNKVKLVIHQRDIKDRLDIVKRMRSTFIREKSTIV